MTQLEFEFRVYRTPEENGKRECIVARSVPHAMQVWSESIDAYSRSLELVISGAWLMHLLEFSETCEKLVEDDVDAGVRNKIMDLCIAGLISDNDHYKRECLEQVLVALGYDLDRVKKEHGIDE
ncbi:MAG: hypothetical protein JW900_08845 [Anaerolineae bacterium]|nr:hypothetical protein [Anaerolineae bacterium]